MTHLSSARLDRNADPGKYHPRCGEAHDRKPAKALIGVGLLVALSFLFHELNMKAHGPQAGAIQHGTAADDQ